VRAILALVAVAVLMVVALPPGCQRVREHVLLSLLRDSERPVDIVDGDPLAFRFPPTTVRAIALIDLQDAATPSGHVSFLPEPGSDRYAWAVATCGGWAADCLETHPGATLTALTYGEIPPGLQQIEPRGGRPAPLHPNRLYGLALFGDKLFVLTVFYRDDAGLHVMKGARFAEAVTGGRREEIRDFLHRS
jgi:hypothetical protein